MSPSPRQIDTLVDAASNAEARFQAVDSSQLTLRMQRLYSVALINKRTGETLSTDFPLDPADGGKNRLGRKAEFYFRVAPRVNNVSEPFSTTITPTQNGGKFVESHGSIIKQIQVQGTTGLRPNKVLPPVIDVLRSFGVDLTSFQDLALGPLSRKQLPDGEATGWDDIIFLRNIFRLYSDIKEGRQDIIAARDVLMVWKNAKDLDFWIVEPADFRLMANANSPMTYEYNISFKTLSVLRDFAFQELEDPLAALMSRRRFLSRIQQYSQALGRAFIFLSAQISRIEAAGVFTTDLIMTPLLGVARGLLAVKTAADSVAAGTKTRNLAQQLFNNLEDTVRKLRELPPGRFEFQDPVIRGFRRMQFVLAHVMTEKPLQDTVANRTLSRQTEFVNRYSRSGGTGGLSRTPSTGGSRTFIGNEELTTSVEETTVRVGESIRDVAQRCLGDRGRWHIIALMNDLRAPYVSDEGGPGVLGPGDTILCPSVAATNALAEEVGAQVNPSERDISNEDESRLGTVQQTYGRDVRLRTVERGGIDVTDLVVGQDGDISTVAGIPNVEQAVKIKFATERGELSTHPRFGSKFPLGSKANDTTFTTYQIDVRGTILSDPRINRIDSLKFLAQGDALLTEAGLRLINHADYLSTSFATRRF